MGVNDARVSIIMPCYNGAAYLEETLRSAIGQTLAPLEIVVIDDGSTDDSASIARSFGPPVRVIRQANRGESAARNVGIAEAEGDYLVFLDADDLLGPTALESQAEAVRGVPGGVALMGCASFEGDPARPYATRMPEADAFLPRILRANFGPPHCWMVPRDLAVRAGGFHEPLRWFEDWEFWSRVALAGATLVPNRSVGAFYRRHPGSQLATTKDADRARGFASVIERISAAVVGRGDLLEAYGPDVFWSGWTALHRARSLGVPWGELATLGANLEVVARRGPDAVRRTWFARLICLLGIRRAEAIRSLYLRKELGAAGHSGFANRYAS